MSLEQDLEDAMDEQGLTDDDLRAGIAGIAMGESSMQMHVETGYSHTSNERIREVFPSITAGMSDANLNAVKATDQGWFDFVYGPASHTGQELGNTQPGDGYKFRGRGFIQLTGRANYERYGKMIGHPELVDNPDLALQSDISAALTVAYFVDRYHGGGFEAMMRCVGNNTPDIADAKRNFYHVFKQTGEFNAGDPNPGYTDDPPALDASGVPSPGKPAKAPVVHKAPGVVGRVLNWIKATV